jgi:hypothetical protein
VVPVDVVQRDPRVVGASDLLANVIPIVPGYLVVEHVASVDDRVDVEVLSPGETPTERLSVVDLSGPRRLGIRRPMAIPDVRIAENEEP